MPELVRVQRRSKKRGTAARFQALEVEESRYVVRPWAPAPKAVSTADSVVSRLNSVLHEARGTQRALRAQPLPSSATFVRRTPKVAPEGVTLRGTIVILEAGPDDFRLSYDDIAHLLDPDVND